MKTEKDYTQSSLSDLLDEQRKIKKSELFSALGIGILAGVIIYGVVKNGLGILYTVIPGLMILGLIRNSKKQKIELRHLQDEIDSRKAN